mmetsp:Transcript_4141/g.12050  ORF Transcript_4141/g.12050 Transcript_4141/m.12050 type:complete len:215 (-) Transcript_4141:3686-4330(-)
MQGNNKHLWLHLLAPFFLDMVLWTMVNLCSRTAAQYPTWETVLLSVTSCFHASLSWLLNQRSLFLIFLFILAYPSKDLSSISSSLLELSIISAKSPLIFPDATKSSSALGKLFQMASSMSKSKVSMDWMERPSSSLRAAFILSNQGFQPGLSVASSPAASLATTYGTLHLSAVIAMLSSSCPRNSRESCSQSRTSLSVLLLESVPRFLPDPFSE